MSARGDVVRGGLAEPVLVQPAQIGAVYQNREGALLAAALAPGALTVTVDDVDPFVDEGGTLAVETADDVSVAADPVAGTPAYVDRPVTEGVRYSRIDRTTNVITLAVPWDAAFPSYAVGDSVWVDPTSVVRLADVALDGDPGQVVTARIPYALQTAIPEGLRIEGEGEWVTVALSDLGDGYRVADVLGEAPVFDPTVETDPAATDIEVDSITAGVVESPSVPRRNEQSRIIYVNAVDGDDDNGGEALAPMVDTFNRAVANGSWGTSDSGHAWGQVVHQGNLQDVELASTSGRLRVNTAGQKTIMVAPFSPLDVEVLATINFDTRPTAGSVMSGVAARIADSLNMVGAEIQVNVAGNVIVGYVLQSGGAFSNPAGTVTLATGLSAAAVGAIDWRIRMQVQTNPDGGTDVRLKAWDASAAEPDAWQQEWNEIAGGGVQSPFRVGAFYRTGASYTGTIQARFRDYLAQVVDGAGEVIDITQGGVGPLASLAAALALVGDWNDGTVTIVPSGIIEEDLDVQGLGGGGALVVDGGNAATLNGYVRFRNVAHHCTLRSLTVQDTGNAGPAASVDVVSAGFVLVTGVSVQGNGYRVNIVRFSDGSRGRVDNSNLHSAGSTRGLYAVNASTVYADDNQGSGATTSYHAACATIFMSGSKPSNATNSTLGGQLLGSTSSNNGGSAPPPQPTKKTDTVTANATQTWRPAWGWDNDGQPKQGEWQGSGGLSRGAAFYSTKLRRSGKTAISGKVYIKRAGSGGMSGKQDIFLATHGKEKQPSSDSEAPNIVNGPSRVGALGYGEGAWFTIPKGWVQDLLTGPARGLMLYHGSASPYVIGVARKSNAAQFKVTITYQ